MKFPQITLSGSPYEKGYAHGSLCKDQVMCSLKNYKANFMKNKKLGWEEAQELAKSFLPVFTGKYEKYLEEMRGIADGAGLKFEEILALNLRTEILYSGLVEGEVLGERGCTAFSALAPATKDGVTLAGQTWDYTIAQRDAAIIARVPAEGDIPAMLLFLEGGIVGGKGVNAAGISLTLNALVSDEYKIGVPLHIRMRRVLECSTLNAAFIEAAATPIAMPANLIITHRDGLSLSLELDPSGCDVILPDRDGIIVHTNHFYGPRMVLNHEHRMSGSTYMRQQRMYQLMHGKKDLTQADIEGFCKDHAGYPTSICVHPDPVLPEEQRKVAGATNYAFVADLTNGIVRFVAGNPCEGEFEVLPITE